MGWLSDRRFRKAYEARRAAFDRARAAGECVLVRQGAIRDLVAERLPFEGFERVRENRWVALQPRAGEFRVLEVVAYKGMAYGLHWGVSLPYVADDGDRRHRTPKAARMDLRRLGATRANCWFADEPDDSRVWFVLPEIDAMVHEAAELAPGLWAATETPAGVAATAEAMLGDPGWMHEDQLREIARLAREQA